MQTEASNAAWRSRHIAAWQAIQHYIADHPLRVVSMTQEIENFLIAIGKSHLEKYPDMDVSGISYPNISDWIAVVTLYSYSNATEIAFDKEEQKFRIYKQNTLLMTTGRVMFDDIIDRLRTDPKCQSYYTFSLMERTFTSADAVIKSLSRQCDQEPLSDEKLRRRFMFTEALAAHRRVWSGLRLHCMPPTGPSDDPISVPKRHVDFMAEVGRVLASYPESLYVCYPDAVMMTHIYHHSTPEMNLGLAYNKEDKLMRFSISEGDQPETVSQCVFTFESVLGMLDSFKENASVETQDVVIKTYGAAQDCLRATLRDDIPPTPVFNLPQPDTIERAAELTLELWKAWNINSSEVLGAVSRTVEACLPAIEAAESVVEQDPVTAMIARQRLMLERIALKIVSSKDPIVKLPKSYANFLTVYASRYETRPEGDWAIFEELHADYFKVVAPADDWKAWYNKSCSVLTLTSVAEAARKNTVPKTIHWAEDSQQRYSFVSFEPLFKQRRLSDLTWPVKISAHSPWDFAIEIMLLDRLERRLKDAGQVDELTLKTLEALDPVVQNCLEELKKGF